MAKTAQAVIETKVKDGASAGFRKVDKAMKNTAKQGKVLNQQFRFMRGGLGQVGHQVQDVAVQLQMGQNAMLVFGQQGSQIASLFGPGGALLGAVLAVGAALSMALLPRLFGATEAMKKLKEESKSLVDRFDELTSAQKKFARLLATKSIKAYKDELAILEKTERGRLTTQNANARAVKRFTETEEEHSARIIELDSNIDSLKLNIAELESKTDGTSKAFQKQEDALLKQIEAYGMSSLAVREYEIRQQVLRGELGVTEGLQLLMHLAELKRLEDITKAREKAAKAGKPETEKQFMARITPELDTERMDIIQKQAEDISLPDAIGQIFTEYENMDASLQASMMNTASTVTSQFETTFDTMSGFFKKGSKEAKAFALISKTLAAANALIQGHVSAALTMTAYAGMAAAAASNPATAITAPAILTAGKAHAATMKVMGGINAGMIMGTALAEASFEGGGFTGRGSRSGGVDGKGGFPAILHPNETVVDHTIPLQKDKSLQSMEAIGSNLVKHEVIVNNLADNIVIPDSISLEKLSIPDSISLEKLSIPDSISLEKLFIPKSIALEKPDINIDFPRSMFDNQVIQIPDDSRQNTLSENKISPTNAEIRETGSIVVNQTINVTTGVQDTVRSEIKNLMPQIAEASKVAVAQETRRGGSYSQMIQGR